MFGAQASGGGFSFGAPNTGTTTTQNAGFSFGAPPTTTTVTAAGGTGGGGFSFGNAPAAGGGGGFSGFSGFGAPSTATTASTGGGTGFNFGMAATKAPGTAASTVTAPPASGFMIGAPTATTTAPAAGGFNFGATGSSGFTGLGGTPANNNAASLSSTAAPTTAPPAYQSAISFGSTAPKSTAGSITLLSGLLSTPSSQPATLTTAATTAASTGFSLGAPTAASSASTGFSFGTSLGQPSATSTSTSLGVGGGVGGGLGLPGFTPSTASSTSASLGVGGGVGGGLGLPGFTPSTASSASLAATAPSLPGGQKQMTFRQLEDTINKWTTELEEQEKSFLDQATQVNAWDRIVMENGEKIIQLNKDLERVKLDQQKLDHELDFVHSQQNELEELLTPLETALEELPPISHTQHAHLEREHTYTLAESLDSQLKRMSQDLKEIVERLNSSNVTPDDNDPLQQITKILNSHVVSLMWVDRNSANLQRRAEEIAKMMDLEKKEQERNFRIAYS